jgi:hypothetical protein
VPKALGHVRDLKSAAGASGPSAPRAVYVLQLLDIRESGWVHHDCPALVTAFEVYKDRVRRDRCLVKGRLLLLRHRDRVPAHPDPPVRPRPRPRPARTRKPLQRPHRQHRPDEALTAQEAQVARLSRDGPVQPGDRRPAVHQRAHGRSSTNWTRSSPSSASAPGASNVCSDAPGTVRHNPVSAARRGCRRPDKMAAPGTCWNYLPAAQGEKKNIASDS